MKKYIGLMLVITLVVSFILGLYLYKLNKLNEEIAFEAEYKKIQTEKIIKQAEEIIKETSSNENSITPNTKVIEKLYYNECEHLVEKEVETDEKLINKNQSELQAEYIGWEIQKFTSNEVVIYKEVNDFCDEHYLLKDIGGEIYVYRLDKYGKEKELVKDTNIQTKYLPEIDLENLKKGIEAYGMSAVNSLIEDYE